MNHIIVWVSINLAILWYSDRTNAETTGSQNEFRLGLHDAVTTKVTMPLNVSVDSEWQGTIRTPDEIMRCLQVQNML